MTTLLELQRRFAGSMRSELDTAIWEDIVGAGFMPGERLRIYRNTFRSTLIGALRITYPAVDRLVGHEFFDAAADAFVRTRTPCSAYLNDYGGGFGSFLESFAPAASLSYLPDVARFEWALSVAANAPDAPVLEPGALAGVHPQDQPRLRFRRHPSVSVLAVSYAVDRIADAVLGGDDSALAEIDLTPMSLHIVVHRGRDGVQAERLDLDAASFVSRLLAGAVLEQLLVHAPPAAPQWLADQLTKGRLQGFEVDR